MTDTPSDKRNKANKSRAKIIKQGEALAREAIKHHVNGNLKKAEMAYKEIINSGLQSPIIFSNLGAICQTNGRTEEAIAFYKNAIKIDQRHHDAFSNLGALYKDLGQYNQALDATVKSLKLKPDNPIALLNLGSIYKDLGKLDQALTATVKSIEQNPNSADSFINLGSIYIELGNLDQALASTLKSLELNPGNPIALMNLGSIYRDLGNLDQALASTLKSLEMKPKNPDALMNLGGIYKELGRFNEALSSTLKSLEHKADSPGAINNVMVLLEQAPKGALNTRDLNPAYELLLKRTDISHRKLTGIFLQVFLPKIQEASKPETIITDTNRAFKTLATDWRFLKSLALTILPHQITELFFTRLRKEILIITTQKKEITPLIRTLTEALATQCYLNEYIYATSWEEDKLLMQAISETGEQQASINQNLAIIGCYMPLHATHFKPDLIHNYPTPDDTSKSFITTQFIEPSQESEIKKLLQGSLKPSNTISQLVQDMYEENPYPRYKYSDFTHESLVRPISNVIEMETKQKDLFFLNKLTDPETKPQVLIAGCGTGSQIISASRYKNTQITAIDLSRSSLAYAIRKTQEYGMSNITFKQMDILNVSSLKEIFDVIECSGVLHHMQNPDEGLHALVQQLNPGGYIQLGLYSKSARKVITKTREYIRKAGIEASAKNIREFRKKVFAGEIKEILNLLDSWKDFYSLSECRDLCFHPQEHLFTTEKIERLLGSQGLRFCGFIIPTEIESLYNSRFPEDVKITSLRNWGIFEKENPSAFASMYQFWAQKI